MHSSENMRGWQLADEAMGVNTTVKQYSEEGQSHNLSDMTPS
jgi:hypothetical protein